MSNRAITVLKVQAHLACLLPLVYLLLLFYRSATSDPAALGPDPTRTVTFFTGFATLRLLVISLAITPVRKLIPQLSWLIRFRRMLGLYAFFWSSLHLLTYLWLYAGWSWRVIADDITKRPYIWAGFTAWVLMVPLAATSTSGSIRRLGGKGWAWLHRAVYISAIAGVVHYWWIVKPGARDPMRVTVTLAILLLARPLLSWWKRKPPARPPAIPAAA